VVSTSRMCFLDTLDIHYGDQQSSHPATPESHSLSAYLTPQRQQPQFRKGLVSFF
jgi:hypothetical protein